MLQRTTTKLKSITPTRKSALKKRAHAKKMPARPLHNPTKEIRRLKRNSSYLLLLASMLDRDPSGWNEETLELSTTIDRSIKRHIAKAKDMGPLMSTTADVVRDHYHSVMTGNAPTSLVFVKKLRELLDGAKWIYKKTDLEIFLLLNRVEISALGGPADAASEQVGKFFNRSRATVYETRKKLRNKTYVAPERFDTSDYISETYRDEARGVEAHLDIKIDTYRLNRKYSHGAFPPIEHMDNPI